MIERLQEKEGEKKKTDRRKNVAIRITKEFLIIIQYIILRHDVMLYLVRNELYDKLQT